MNDPQSVEAAWKAGLVIMSIVTILAVVLSSLLLYFTVKLDKRVKVLEGAPGVAELLKLYRIGNGRHKT